MVFTVSVLTRRMAIAKGTCVSFCNQPKAHHFGYLTRVTPVCRCHQPICDASIWLHQESLRLRHILVSPGYAPGTIAVNVTWIERGFNACQTYRSMYHLPSTVYELYSEILVKNCNFFLPPCIYSAPVGVFPLEFREKV